jgi:twitching motility two-component system response regulator PilH
MSRSVSVNNEKLKVLTVDDEPLVLDFIDRFLTAQGMKVVAELSAVKALEKLETFDPDVILLDIDMPEIDGYDLASRIGAIDKHSNVPIVFLSGYDIQTDSARSFASGGEFYIRKPIKGSVLVEVVETAAICSAKDIMMRGTK